MDPFQMVVLIVLISVGAGVLNTYFKSRASAAVNTDQDAELARMQADIDRLKERVRVLEKITTDSDRELSEQIRRLA